MGIKVERKIQKIVILKINTLYFSQIYRVHKRIQNPVQNLRWSFLRKKVINF